MDGEAEPRLTSGGIAGGEGVKFQNRLDLQDGISHPACATRRRNFPYRRFRVGW